ncbi:MAG TPA: hypothetical protein DCP75_01165 [Haliea salexigens]|uniref:EF-hand domain-containing protein n=1 Tax=Haliea salexigens TaxID=287487 RepID=A0A3C1KIS2_9GAMM|nr:hypothetical protein [Haliea sp.]HAN26348.1 hypothetical protein [Haliea salexigens]|tara:strand:- start:3386 stop:3757 length:372 start_codon:yes stop_codon:yes gene_type:complete
MRNGLRFGRAFLLAFSALSTSACDQLFTDPPFDSDGKLTSAELHYFLGGMKEATNISEKMEACIKTEAERRADIAGDPETLKPESLSLPDENWVPLDKSDKRLILAQLVVTEASVFCTTGREM